MCKYQLECENMDVEIVVFLLYLVTLCDLHLCQATYDFSLIRHRIFDYTNITFSHAESPVWDPQSNTLYWVDVLEQDIHALQFPSMRHRVKHTFSGETNLVLPIANSKRLLVAAKNKVYIFSWHKHGRAALTPLVEFDRGSPGNVINDGKADALGRLWGGTKGPQNGNIVVKNKGTLYSIEPPSFSPRVQLNPVTISNGLTWSLNNTVFYYIDSETRKVEAFDFDLERATISGRRTILDVSKFWDYQVIPDGMTRDRDGFLWVALMFNGSVIRINPESRTVVEVYQLPVTSATCVAWAGKNLDQLVVTTSKRNLDTDALTAQPLAGALFFLHGTGTAGVPDFKFNLPIDKDSCSSWTSK